MEKDSKTINVGEVKTKEDFILDEVKGESLKSSRTTVAILGSGDYSRSLAERLVRSGFPVAVGSRDPDRNRRLFPQGAEVTTRRAAVSRADLVFVAVHRENYPDLRADQDALAGKILIDVSNNTKIQKGESNAEYLAKLFPSSTVVKAFNVVSAWTLSSGLFGGSKEVLVSSDDADARQTVMQLAKDMGFAPVDYGSLMAAREIEAIPLRLLPSWHLALKMSFGVFVFLLLYSLYRGIVFKAIVGDPNIPFQHIPLHYVNRTMAGTAITILCFVYFPGVLAFFLQLYNGTKYKRFPNWLDKWLLARKQLGLLCLFVASIHACLSVLDFGPASYGRHYDKTTVTSEGDVVFGQMRWSGETFLLFGTLAFFLMVVLGVTSIPSVTNAMNWREFTFVQAKLGWVVLIFATTHMVIYGAEIFILPGLFASYTIAGFQITLILPAILILLKVVTLLPCISSRVDRIRRGWEAKVPGRAEAPNNGYQGDEMTPL
ncbi:metalloreductase STEAP3-like [Branchiostoma lanceolatum]|uniref:metalloreductase STEAP3-like n=1 Tax=Branchiostoma lanceolatum TaxID=7740 RepID=UPI0034533D99